MRIIIDEFMDPAAVAALAARFDVVYDETLVDHRDDLLRALGDAHAIIVRNRTQVTALRQEQLGGAALDVFAREPLPAGSLLANCPNLLLTPHIAGVTFESTVRVSTLIADEVAAFLDAR